MLTKNLPQKAAGYHQILSLINVAVSLPENSN